MRTALLYFTAALGLLSGCDSTPSFVDANDVGAAFTIGRYATVCKGLEMEDAWTREFSAQKLVSVTEPIAAECLCEHAVDTATGAWDSAILKGISGSGRDDFATCFLPVFDNPNVENRDELVAGLIATSGPSVMGRFLTIMEDTSEPGPLRAKILATLPICENDESIERYTAMMQNDPAPEVRARLANDFVCSDTPAMLDLLLRTAAEDEAPLVRSAALTTADRQNAKAAYDVVCDAMLEDEAPEVRKTAVELFRAPKKKGAKGKRELACLRKKAFKVEDNEEVREALLTSLQRSPRQDAADVLCDAIPFWVQNYVENTHPDRMTGTDISGTQNNRDFVNTPRCLQQAYNKRSRYTCKGKQYVAAWAREVGLSVHVPKCDALEGF